MSSPEGQEAAPHITLRSVEAAVALLFIALGTVVAVDSERIGAGWAADGPQAGYFPFYIGLLLILSGLSVLLNVVRLWREHTAPFVTYGQLRLVFSVLGPTVIYVGAVYLIGIYVASAIFIAWFMVAHGKFGVLKTAIVSIAVPAVLFLLFEVWFLVPLPKGPLERLLGY